MTRTGRKRTKYVLRGESRDLDLRFYQGFDEDFLFNKAALLYFVVEEFETFKSFAESKGFDFEERERSFLDSLRAEIHFTEIHQAEALFALMIACLQSLPDWLYLNKYETAEIKGAVRHYVAGNISALTKSRTTDPYEFLQVAVYSGVESTAPEIRSRWAANLDNIAWLLQRIGTKYLDAPEYNAYKHGLRVLPGGASLVMYPDGHPDQAVTVLQSRDALTFLELKDGGEGGLTVHETTKHFSFKESYAHLFAMSRLMRAIKRTRLGVLSGAEQVELPTFFDLDRERFVSFAVTGSWSFTV